MIQKTTNRDTIIDAIHRTRQRMAEKFDGDIAAILRTLGSDKKLRGALAGPSSTRR